MILATTARCPVKWNLGEQYAHNRRLRDCGTHIEAISAREADTGIVNIQVAMYNQTVPDLPPLIKEKVPVLKIASHVAMITHVSPRIDTEWNARCNY